MSENKDYIKKVLLKASELDSDGGIGIAKEFISLKDSIDSVESTVIEIKDGVNKKLDDMSNELKKKLELDFQINPDDIRGEDGKDGIDGETPSDYKLIELIKPLIPAPINGKDGTNGKDGKDAEPVDTDKIIKFVQESIDLKEFNPLDNSGLIRDSLELLNGDDRLDISSIRGLDDYQEICKLAKEPRTVIKKYTGGSVPNFINLIDTPSSYASQTGKYIRVNSTEDGLEFATIDLSGYVQSVTGSGDVSVDNTDPQNPVVSVDLSGYVPFMGDSSDVNIGTYTYIGHAIKGDASDGIYIRANNDTNIGLLGAGNTANVTWYGSHNFSTATQDTIAGFTGTGKTLGSLSTATYPSLTELSYVKGVTSAIQTQLGGKQATLVSGTNIKTINSTSLLGSGNISVGTITGSGTTNQLAYFSSGTALGSMSGFYYDSTNTQLVFGGVLTSGSASYGDIYCYTYNKAFLPMIRLQKATYGSILSLDAYAQSPVIEATGGNTFVIYSQTDTGTYLSNSYAGGSTFSMRNDNDNYATYGLKAIGSNQNSAPSSGRAYTYGFWGTAQGHTSGNGGAVFYGQALSANIDGVRIDLASSQTAPAINIRNSSSSTIMSVNADGSITPTSLADSSASNNTIYYSTTASKLVYKDSGGTVNNLY